MNKFKQLLSTNVNKHVEKKNGMSYLTWSHAWAEFVKVYPDTTYQVINSSTGLPAHGNPEMGYMVYTAVKAGEITHSMWLPVMDYRNKSILQPTTFDINKAVMRCLVKNLAMFGLGLYIYAGEDLPEEPEADPDYRLKENLRKQIEAEINKKGADRDKLKKYFKVEHIYQLTEKQQAEAMQMLAKKKPVKADKFQKLEDEIKAMSELNQMEKLNQKIEKICKDDLQKMDELKEVLVAKINELSEVVR